MKYICSVILFLVMCSESMAADITLIIKNIDISEKGEIAFGVYESDNWLDDEKYIYSVRKPVTGKTMRLKIKDVKPGLYGIAGYHDSDVDHEVDKNFIGIPTEQVGFSNGAKIGFGAPDFEDARIRVKENGKNEFEIEMD